MLLGKTQPFIRLGFMVLLPILAVGIVWGAAPPSSTNFARTRGDQQGDSLPEQAIARLGTQRFRCDEMTRSVAYSGDGKYIVSGAYRGRVRLWSASTGQFLRSLDPQEGGSVVCCSKDGSLLAAGSGGHPGAHVVSIKDKGPREFIIWTSVNAMSFSPDSSLLAIGGSDKSG